jgi:hypothetical protein
MLHGLEIMRQSPLGHYIPSESFSNIYERLVLNHHPSRTAQEEGVRALPVLRPPQGHGRCPRRSKAGLIGWTWGFVEPLSPRDSSQAVHRAPQRQLWVAQRQGPRQPGSGQRHYPSAHE